MIRAGMICTLLMLALVSKPGQAEDIDPAGGQLSASEQAVLEWLDGRGEQLLEELRQHVNINTGTGNLAGIDRYRGILATQLRALGFVTREYESEPLPLLSCEGEILEVADHLVATRTGDRPNRILLNGHMDTVFPATDEFQSLRVDEDGTLHGPGVLDMKGGIVVMLNALRALQAVGRLDDANITVLFNSDEEIGSLGSRPLIEQLAREHDVGLVFEGSRDNRLVRARKGLGQARLRVTGRESHAGSAHEEGVSANLALAHRIIGIEALTDYPRQVTVNVGVMRGGEKRNTIPGCAEAFVDLRFPTPEQGDDLVAAIEEIASAPAVGNPAYPDLPRVDVWAVLHRPVKAENAEVDALIAEAMQLSSLIGEPIAGGMYSGGGTDGSLAQAVGLPTLDTLGLNGDGAHSSREHASVQSLLARTKLAAVMIGRQLDRSPWSNK